MSILRSFALATAVLWATAPVTRAQEAPALTGVTVDQKADAILGLGRVARDRGDRRTAHERFLESERLRPFDAALREEHFWIAVHVAPSAAMAMARHLAEEGQASRAVCERWVALAATASFDEAREALELVTRRHPDTRWAAAWASLGLRAEAAGQTSLAAQAWAKVPPPVQESRDDWHASSLRVAVARSSRAAMAEELDAYVQAHAQDDGMRRLAVEAWADAGKPARALALLKTVLGPRAAAADIRRAADLALAGRDLTLARQSLERLAAGPSVTTADVAALAGVLATQRDAPALRRVFAGRPAVPCAADRLAALMAAGDETLLADLVPSLSSSCAAHAEVARRIAVVWLARDRADVAETWLRAVSPDRLTDAHRVLLARALSVRRAWQEVDAVLAPVTSSEATTLATEAAGLRVWAWAGLGRAADAWALATRTQAPDAAPAAQRAGWAALALSAGDTAGAARLARAALGSDRDVDARAVLASLAAVEGRPAAVREWLAPVAAVLRQPGHIRLWLDAADAIGGAARAIEEIKAYDSIVSADLDLLASRATWHAAVGDTAAAHRDVEQVKAQDPARAARLDVAVRLASGDASGAWDALEAQEAIAPAGSPAWQRLRLDVAVAAERWRDAIATLAGAGDALSPAERILATGRIALGEHGRLPADTREALEGLVARNVQAAPAQVILAAADVVEGNPAHAVARLAVSLDDPSLPQARPDLRAVLAAALLRLERPADVLRVAFDTAGESPALRVLRAQAQVRLGQAEDARRSLGTLARETRRADAYLAWAEASTDAAARADVLRQAVAAHPTRVDVGERYLLASFEAGRHDLAATDAIRLLAMAPSSRVAWQVRLRLAANGDETTVTTHLHEAWTALAEDPERAYVVAEAMTHASRLPAPVLTVLAGWLAAEEDDARAARLQALLAVNAGIWPVAEDALLRLRRLAPGDAGTQRLEAQVAAWSGRHAEAVPRYRAYLEARPDDADAWREYARLLTWRGDAAGSSAAYARLQALTTAPAVTAEAQTKRALLRHDWNAAARAAAAWGALEPASLDAAVDLAQALEQDGRASAAEVAWADVARRPGLPDVVQRSLDARRARTTGTVVGRYEVGSTDAFGGMRLVDTRLAGLAGEMPVRRGGSLWLTGQADQGQLRTVTGEADVLRGDLGLRAALGAGIRSAARVGAVRVGAHDLLRLDAQVAAPVMRHLGVDALVSRQPFWENAGTVAAGLHATTAGVGVRLLASGDVDATVHLSQASISDGNTRRQVDASVGRLFGGGRQVLELRASGFLFGLRRQTSAYFSPDSFGRVDMEVGLTRWLGQGSTVRDARHLLRARTGLGVDSEGRPYVLGAAGVVVPLGGSVGMGLDGRWTSSRVYRAWQFTAGLQVGLGRPAQGGAAASERP